MREHGSEERAVERFLKAVEVILSFRKTVEHHVEVPIKEWIGGDSADEGISTFPNPIYRAEVRDFFTAVGKCLDLWTPVASNYQEASMYFLRDHILIMTASSDEVKALLTHVYRGERFYDGFWGEQLETGLASVLLDRLYQLYQSGEVKPVEYPC